MNYSVKMQVKFRKSCMGRKYLQKLLYICTRYDYYYLFKTLLFWNYYELYKIALYGLLGCYGCYCTGSDNH